METLHGAPRALVPGQVVKVGAWGPGRIGTNGIALSLGEAQEVGGGVRARALVSAGEAASALSGWAKRVAGSVGGRFVF